MFQCPTLVEDLLSSVDQPLKVARDKETGKDYLLCDYNRDGDSYRSVTVRWGKGSLKISFLQLFPLYGYTGPCICRTHSIQ
jgi:hypothetical protein